MYDLDSNTQAFPETLPLPYDGSQQIRVPGQQALCHHVRALPPSIPGQGTHLNHSIKIAECTSSIYLRLGDSLQSYLANSAATAMIFQTGVKKASRLPVFSIRAECGTDPQYQLYVERNALPENLRTHCRLANYIGSGHDESTYQQGSSGEDFETECGPRQSWIGRLLDGQTQSRR